MTRMVKQRIRAFSQWALLASVALLWSGCEYVIQPLKGTEGRTLVYAAVGTGGAPNAGIILTRIGAIVIDPPLNPELGQRLNMDALKHSKVFWDELHRTNTQRPQTQAPPVLYVLNTTYRASHTFGNQAFIQKAEFIATEKASKHLSDLQEGRKMRQLLEDEFKVPGLQYHATVEPTITFDGVFSINSKEAEVKCISTGDCVGEGDMVVFLPQQKILFAGDLVIPGFMPYPKGRTATVINWIKALKKMEAWDVEVVVPGHGNVGDKNLIRQQREFLETLVMEIRRAIEAKKTIAEAAQTVRLANYARWANYEKWIAENVSLVYSELTNQDSASSGSAGHGASMATFEKIEKPDAYRDR